MYYPQTSNFRKCQQPFPDGNFFEQDGFPYCEYCYHEMRGAPCAGCGKPISGRCITAMFRKFHPEHFVCSFCLKQLNKGTFKEQDDKPYCHGCFDRLFGWNARSTSPLLCTSKFLSVRDDILLPLPVRIRKTDDFEFTSFVQWVSQKDLEANSSPIW